VLRYASWASSTEADAIEFAPLGCGPAAETAPTLADQTAALKPDLNGEAREHRNSGSQSTVRHLNSGLPKTEAEKTLAVRLACRDCLLS
jgi:hypothetical protein